MVRKYVAEEGLVWKLKSSEELLSEVIYLGKGDNIERYEQFLKSVEHEE